jgi:hypothetical protein
MGERFLGTGHNGRKKGWHIATLHHKSCFKEESAPDGR